MELTNERKGAIIVITVIINLIFLPLLFISAGSSSLLSIFVLLGICQANIANKE